MATAGAQSKCANEWWQLFGHLRTHDSAAYDFAVTINRYTYDEPHVRGLHVSYAPDLFVATAIVTDVPEHRSLIATKRDRGAIGLAHAGAGRLDLRIGDWLVDASPDRSQMSADLRAQISYGTVALDITQAVHSQHAVEYDGANGVGTPRANVLSHAWAYPRLNARGTLRIDGRMQMVSGFTWLLHEYGRPTCPGGLLGWSRFEIQFDDGRALMISVPRARRVTANSCGAAGFYVSAAGRVSALDQSALHIENPLETRFTSPRTGRRYPSLWEVIVPNLNLDLAVVPPVQDQEVASSRSSASVYDGAVDVESATPPSRDFGSGRVELTGYGSPVILR